MKEQKRKIAKFLEGIIDHSLPPEKQIMLFSQEESVEGADTSNSGCINKASACGGSINSGCLNYDDNCFRTDNTTCTTLNSCESNEASCQILNPSISLCGGEGGDA